MKKYYIPTTTLNFNNILSSESISPKAFYALRGFGYSSWESIPENNVDNVIILYEKPFKFTRPESDLADHPMLIEICTEEQFPSVCPGIVYCDHTIYLSIGGTRFIFFSEQDKRVTLSRSEHSIETKFYEEVWGKYMVVGHFPNAEKRIIQLDIGLNQRAIEKDYRINKMKGVLYGFFIGKILFCSFDKIRQLQILQELQDIATTILSSKDHIPTILQTKQAYDLLKEYQRYTTCGYILQELNTDWEKVYDIVSTLIINGAIFSDLFDITNLMGNFQLTDKSHPFIHWLKGEHEKHFNSRDFADFASFCVSELLKNKEIVVADLCLSEITFPDGQGQSEQDSQDIELLKSWVNDTLLQKKYHGNPNVYMADLSDEIIIRAEEAYKDLWEDSNIRQLLNEMRHYVRGEDNRFTWNEILTSSIAAVIVKGDDWKELLAFMQSKGMCDYRLAFAFYGELQGFANLDRLFTDFFYRYDCSGDAYKDFYHQLLGVYPVEACVNLNEDIEYELCHEYWSFPQFSKEKFQALLEEIRKLQQSPIEIDSELNERNLFFIYDVPGQKPGVMKRAFVTKNGEDGLLGKIVQVDEELDKLGTGEAWNILGIIFQENRELAASYFATGMKYGSAYAACNQAMWTVDREEKFALYAWASKHIDNINKEDYTCRGILCENLAKMYHFGIGTQPNNGEAERWYQTALANGNNTVLNNLGVLYDQCGRKTEAIRILAKQTGKIRNADKAQRNKNRISYRGIDEQTLRLSILTDAFMRELFLLKMKRYEDGWDELLTCLPDLTLDKEYTLDSFSRYEQGNSALLVYARRKSLSHSLEQDSNLKDECMDTETEYRLLHAFHYITLPFTEDAIWQAFLLSQTHRFIERCWHDPRATGRFILIEKDIINMKEIPKEIESIWSPDLNVSVTLEGESAIISYCWFDKWEGLVQMKWEVKYDVLKKQVTRIELKDERVLVKYECGVRY